MKKFSKYLLMPLLAIFSIILTFTLTTAQEDDGKIILTKTATKTYDENNEENLEYGRLAKVSLKVNANSYKNNATTIQPLDIVIVFDGSGSMAWGPKGQYEEDGHTVIDWSTPSRLDSAKSSATDFVNTLMDETGNVQIGIVEFGNSVKDVQTLTADKNTVTTFISNRLDADGGTNLQAGIARANELLEDGRENAKKIVIILTDGIPTYFNYIDEDNDVRRAGNGKNNSTSDIEVCTKFEERENFWGTYTVCTESEEVSRTPSAAAKIELDSLKTTYSNADVYTITFGEETEAATILAEVNPEQATPLYKNYTALTGEALKEKFGEIIEQTKDIIGKNSIATDVIPKEFTLTTESKTALEAQGINIKENTEDGTTTLTWNIGNIEAGKELELSYVVRAKDEYHGSMYTNESATLITTVEESNPAYSGTSLNLAFDKEQPTVEIPAIANNDHYNDNSSYIAYGQEKITGTSILNNDLNKIILTDNENDDLTDFVDETAKVVDTIVVNEDVNTVKVANTDNTYKIYKDGTLQGILVMNTDGTFTFQAEENITGEVTFSYHIDTSIDPMKETSIVHSNDATVTLLINERKTKDITGTKTWVDNNNQDGKRPSSITVNLLADGTKIASKEVNSTNNWEYEFNNLYVYELGHENDDDYEITYSVEEIKVTGYTTKVNGYNITNTHEIEKTEVTGTKTWEDNNNQDGKRPESITVRLYADGKEVDSKEVTSTDNWKYTFDNLDKYANGKEIEYTVTEDEVTGYTTTYDGNDITNTHEIEKTEVTGTKTWEDNNNQDGKRPESITVNLLADGTKVDSKEVSADEDGNWTYTFANLDKYANGKEIEYTVIEDTVEGYTTKYDGNNIINSHETELTEVSGTKTWEDNNDQDGKRPSSITVNLLADGTKVDSKEVSADEDGNWTYTFANLDKYANGKEIEYTVIEDTVEGYTTKYDGNNIINSHETELTEVSGTKTWEDNNDQDGKRPSSITVNLLADGTKVDSKEVSADEDGNWTYTFGNLDKYANGKEIEYTVTEDAVTGYTTEVNGYNITNTHTPETTEVIGKKIWNDNNNQDGKRSESITVRLYANGKEIDSKEVTSANNWTYTFTNLDKYANGKEIEYTVTEDTVEGYTTEIKGYNITNTHEIEKTEVTGTKTWEDNNNQDGKRPESITVNLLADGTKVDSKEVSADEDGNWTYTFGNLDKYANGKEIVYTITEDTVEEYTTKVNGHNITNTHEIEKTEVTGTKTWEDNNNQDGKRPESITVRLYANGKEIDSKEVTSANNWTYTFENLDKYTKGKEIVYTVTEDTVKEYTTEIKGYNITNTHEIEKTKVSGTKTWEDNNNQDGKRPKSITVRLYANGKEVTSQEVSPDNKGKWTYTFENLDKYANGKEIVYTVTEDAVEGYTTKYDGNNIINSHETELIEISGKKIWDDNNDQDGKRPESITVRLYADGKEIDSKEVTSANNWTYTFENLDKYTKGKEIVYTVTEDTVEGYTTEIKGYNITNTHEIEKTEVSGTKTWQDNNNQDGKRPESITVNLLADGTKVDSKEVTADDEGNWTYIFEDLDKYANGKEIEYTVTEDAVASYTTKVNGYNITNTHEIEKTEVSGTKTWQDNNNQDGKRPESITVNLLVDGTKVDSKEVSADEDGNWTYTFANLDKYANGKEIEYTVIEDTVEGYTTKYDGNNIINSHETELTEVSGTKTWEDNNDQDGKRPSSITVNLLADGTKVKSLEVTAETNWTYTFANLDKYANGKEIVYTVTEDIVEGYTSKITGYNITNTHTPETTEVIGKKIWNDNNNQDGFRPKSITVRLYADNEEINSATITEGENGEWTYAFINLPKYKEGKVIEYTVIEDKVEEYTTTYDETNPYIIINTHQTKKIEVSGTKTWNDNSNQDGFRPESITVRLYANGEEIDSKEVTEETNWTYTFENLDMYKEGKLIGYTITEDAVANYSTEIDGYNITNTHTPEKISINGIKTWEDNNNQDGKRPESITINLIKDEEVIATTTATEETNWTYTFKNLDKYENGQEIVYILTEETVDGYVTEINGYDITNTHEIEKITFKTTKVWDDNDNQDGIRPTEINVNLYKNGELLSTVKVTEEDNWTYIFENLDRYENGKEIIYTIEEDIVLGYNTEINYNEIDENNIISSTIINTHTPEKIEININKTWNDYDNIEEIRPENISVELYANGEHIKTVIVTDQEHWKYTITELDKYQNGEEIVYTIKEKEVEGYTTEYDGFNIINTHELGKGGDVEELPPQTGIEIASPTTQNSNTMIYLIMSLLTFWIIGLKKIFN